MIVLEILENTIQSTFNEGKNMGIEEAILTEIKEKSALKGKIECIKKPLNKRN